MDGKRIEIEVKNLDHLGIVAGIIDEIGLVEQVNEVLGTHKQEVINPNTSGTGSAKWDGIKH